MNTQCTKNPNLEDLVMENVLIYSEQTTLGYILWAFGNFVEKP
jgi:hypothetical protein